MMPITIGSCVHDHGHFLEVVMAMNMELQSSRVAFWIESIELHGLLNNSARGVAVVHLVGVIPKN